MTRRGAIAALLWLVATPAEARVVALAEGTPVALVTAGALSSKTSAKGDMVALRLAHDLVVDGAVVATEGTPATGQVAESRGTGGMGMTGKLIVRPLFLRAGNRVVRLAGAARDKGQVGADTVLGLALLTPLISGKSATIPAGTPVPAVVEKRVELTAP